MGDHKGYLINLRSDIFTLNNYAFNGLTVSGLPSMDTMVVNVNGTLLYPYQIHLQFPLTHIPKILI
jgi:hypothetical protein